MYTPCPRTGTENEIHKVFGRRQRYLARSDSCLPSAPPLSLPSSSSPCCSKSGISRKVSRQGAPPTFICEARAILMKLDCVRPRHRKLSPDGRWTDMEFDFSAEMEKRESIRRRRGELFSKVELQTPVLPSCSA